MENDLDNLFNDLKFHIDNEEPTVNHKARFLKRLHKNELVKTKQRVIVLKRFRSVLSVAASLLLMLGIFVGMSSDAKSMELSKISEEMANTEDYFKIAIELELEKINNNNNPEVQKILKSALSKLSELENAYDSLKKDLVNSGTDKRVIHAMVQNLQNRMELLKNVQLQLAEIN
jgi:uncharacterized protein YsxB (DUF464 family)